jgi:hypothetical protein
MDDQVRALAYEVFGLLNLYINCHNDMLGRRWLAWVRPIDFGGNARKLGQVHAGLQASRSTAVALKASPQSLPRHRDYLSVLLAYLDALSDTVTMLRDVAVRMNAKASGGRYEMAEYRGHMNTYLGSVDRYTQAGEDLKAAWDRAQL